MGNFYTDKNGVLRNTDDDAEYEVKSGKIVKKKKKTTAASSSDIAPIDNRKWYQKGHFEDGYNFGDVTKTILGVEDKKTLKTFTAPETDLTLEELKQKRDYLAGRTWNTAEQSADLLKYTQQYNQMALYQYSDTLSKTQMDGQNHTVLEEIEILANMKSGKEKDKRKAAVLKKMEELGMDSSFYADFAGDGEFSWGAFGKWAENAAMAGLAGFNKGLMDTADVILGAPMKALGWEDNPFSEGAEYYGTVYDTYKYNANIYANELGGGAWNFGSEAIEGTTGALPNALLMFMTGGASATATTSSLTTQSAMQTGNWLTKTGLTVESMMKNPQYWMSFSRTLGSDYKEAKELGASDAAATVGSILKSMVNSGIEIGLDGGSGIQGLGDAMKKGGKPFYEWVESSLEEGGEEMLQKFVGEVINKAGYGSDEEILNPVEYAKEGALGVISGAALGGGQTAVQSGVNAFNEHQQNKLTDFEKSVVDKLVEKAVSKKENATTEDKKKIRNEITENLKKGYISVDDIEEAIGGDDFTKFSTEKDNFFASDSFKEISDLDKRIKQSEKQLQELGEQQNTVANSKKYDSIQNRIDILTKRKNSIIESLKPEAMRINGIKQQMRANVFNQVKGTRLSESYNELARKSQKYEVDVEQYEGKAKETVQNIIDSGLGDNSNQFHELVDFLAKISSDKGVTFNFTKTELLKGTKHYKEGYITNGFVDDNGNVVLNKDSNNAIHTIVGHEVTHVLKKGMTPENYKVLESAVRDYCIAKEGQKGYDARLEAAKEAYKDKTNTTAEEEVTADIVGEYLFTDSEFVNKLSIDDRSTFEKIYDEIKYLWKVATAGSHEKRELERVKKIFDKAWRENVKGKVEDTQHSYSSIANSLYGTEGISTEEFEAMFDKDKHLETEFYQKYEAQCLSNMRQTMDNFDEHKAKVAIRKQFNGIMRVAVASKKAGYDISDILSVDGENVALEGIEDSKNRKLFSSLEPNSDYFTSHDISTICDKRKNFAEIYDEIVRREEALGVPEDKRFFNNVSNYFAIHDIMAKQGLTTPCRQCYVESMRKNLAPMAKSFLELVGELDENNISNAQLYHQKGKNKGELKTNNAELRKAIWETLEAHPEYNLSVSDLTVEMLSTEDGLAQLRIQAPLIYEAFNSFYGQAKPKMPKSPTPFRFGELTAMLTDDKGKIKEGLVKKINSTGGFRFQSYSDFQIQNYVDVLQALFEAGTLGLNGHSYTKVPAFLDATEGTNLKRNISIFMYKDGNEWKLDRNDSFPYSLEEIYKIVEADKTGNTSIIAVSQNNEMSAWIMANDLVGYGIPFHKSGLAMATVRETIVREGGRDIKGYKGIKDHTKQQTEVWKSTAYKENGEIDHKAGTKVKKGISIYEIDWDFENKGNLSKKELIEKNLKTYIDECERLGYIPKFRDYVMNNSKVLDDVLRFSKELGFVSKDATIEDISFSYKGYQVPYGYYKFLGDFGMFTPDGKAAPQKPLSLENYDFDKAVEFFADSETLRRNEILQQFSNGQVRKEMRDSDLTTEELADIVADRRKAVADEAIAPTQYSMTKDSNGRDLTSEQQEYFAEHGLKDEDGNLLTLYRSADGGRTVWGGRGKGSSAQGIFLTDDYYVARGFAASRTNGDDILEVYARAENPFVIDAHGNSYVSIPLPDDAPEWLAESADIYDELNADKLPVTAFANGYDAVIIRNVKEGIGGDPATDVVLRDSNQFKRTDNTKPTADPDIRYSVTKAEKTKMDQDYLDAVENGDEDVVKHLVREYAKASMPDSKLVDENGNLREVYHGTNTGDFTVFNPDYIGMSSGDDGFFGMGFYFAYSKGEAAYYGANRVIPAYLNLTNPFDFEKELQTYNGERARYGHAPDAVALMNFADKFPDIAMSITLGAVKNGQSSGESISVFEFAKAFKDVIENKDFEYQELVNEYGESETLVTADPQIHEYEYNGEIHSYRDYGFQKRWYDKPNKLDVAYEYLSNAVYSYLDIPRRTRVILDNNREFTTELKRRGYDGAIQSERGDEAVAFYPHQIKSAKPITRDDDGNVIPLSKRFDSENDDIRYSMTKIESEYMDAVNNGDTKLAEFQVEEMANIAMPDSKIRDKKGRLIPVYHGTNADFWEFDTSRDGGKNGTAEGFGIYLSDNQEVTNAYGDRQIKMFANITKPATSFKKTIKASTLVKLIKHTCETEAKRMVAEDGYDSLKDALRDTWVSNYADTYGSSMDQVYRELAHSFIQNNDNDKDIIHEVMFGMAIRSYDQAMAFYRTSLTPVTGIDGFITEWDNANTGETSTIYLAFDSSQLKSADAVTYDESGKIIPLSERFNLDKKDIRYSLSPEGEEPGYGYVPSRDIGVNDPLADFAPIRETVAENTAEDIAPDVDVAENETTTEEPSIAPDVDFKTTDEKLNEKLVNRQKELENIQKLRSESAEYYDEQISKAQAELDSKKNKNTKAANRLKMRIERLQRLKADIDAKYAKRIKDITKSIDKTTEELEKDHTEKDRYTKAKERIDKILELDKAALRKEYAKKKAELEAKIADKDAYFSNMAKELYDELRGLRKGIRASENLGSLLDAGFDWGNLRSALSNVRYNPSSRVNESSVEESAVRQLINEAYENDVYSLDDIDLELVEKISELEAKAEEERKNARRATQRRTKDEQYNTEIREMIGDTSTWVDLPIGLLYKTKTLRRILRTVVRDANGKPDIAKADQIYDYIETAYDHNEASLKKESIKLKSPFVELKLTSEEDVYAQMLGELRHNPETTLSEDVVKEYYEKHKKKINPQKVDKAIEEARKLYDDLIERVNEVLKEQGYKEIPYRKGYFPHFTNPKQTWWMKALNWKPIDTEIPTNIAGLTETFKPQRSWQKFDKHRYSDQTDYSLYKGLDTYVHGALDWIYHIEDLQKRRALENYLRFIHSDEGIKAKIDEVKNSNLDAEEAQERIDSILKEAKNPLGGLVRELMNRTNTLANKKAADDRALEDKTNRKIYSTLTNLNNRVSANMVVGSISSALTNFIPIVQSWHQVSPYYSVSGLRDMIRSTIKDDGVVAKSDFLTNRLMEEENLYKTNWDKVADKAALMMNGIDNITAQTVWRSKYLQNLSEHMSESAAINDADQFAKNVMAGRSRGNAPTIFDAKNPINKLFTAFQLEVANQYGYMFNDVVKDSTSKTRLVKGYATALVGAYVYNALYSTLVGRDAAFDPIGIIEDLLRGLFDDEEENEDALLGFGEDILQEVPYIGGLLGGGRVPLQSAIPYSNDNTPIQSMVEDAKNAWNEGNPFDEGWTKRWTPIVKEMLKPLYYLVLPFGGGQFKKTAEGLGMYLGDHPIDGSYTDSGNLRFPVEDTFGNVVQAGLFGQYASKNARDYFDNDWAPLADKQITEYSDLGMDFKQYHEIRDGLKDYDTLAEKVNYINSLDISDEQKNILVNNLTDRKTPIDMSSYGDYGDLEEYDFATKNPGKYAIAKVYGYDQYKAYTNNISNISGTKDANGKTISGSRKAKVFQYINSLPLSKEEKMLLFKSEYPADDSYNRELLEWLDSMYSLDDIKTMLEELGFHVYNGTVTWD